MAPVEKRRTIESTDSTSSIGDRLAGAVRNANSPRSVASSRGLVVDERACTRWKMS